MIACQQLTALTFGGVDMILVVEDDAPTMVVVLIGVGDFKDLLPRSRSCCLAVLSCCWGFTVLELLTCLLALLLKMVYLVELSLL